MEDNIFSKGCLVKLETSCWTGRVRIPSTVLLNGSHDDVDPTFVGAHKRLVDGDALKAIEQIRSEARTWLYARSLPFPIEGVCFVPTANITKIDEKLSDFERRFNDAADAFAGDFAAIREAARQKLGQLYDESDYPRDIRRKFDFGWRFITFAPAGESQLISPEIVEREQRKFQELMARAQADAVNALRERFAALVDHAVERLSGEREGGKPKIFRDTLVGNIREFLESFETLNIADDKALHALVERVRALTDGVDTKGLRDDASLRAHVATKMTEVQNALDGMMIERPTRKIRLGPAPSQPASEAQ